MRTGLLVVALLACLTAADVYMHNPSGSNDRLNENNANRQNGDRLFDSQNNNKGGYCWTVGKMYYYVGSELNIEWTAQHSCGTDNNYCDIVLQYMCSDVEGLEVRNGLTTTTIPDNEDQYNEKDPNTQEYTYGMHESYQFYQDCKARTRNEGLFIADRNVGPRAINTRQNNNGGRRGFECPEERDYYPYWHPTPWKDIAILTSGYPSRCALYQSESQNVLGKNYCTEAEFNNDRECIAGGGQWLLSEPWNIDAPVCLPAPVARDNHLGNTIAPDGVVVPQTASYKWTIPDDASENCVLRLRYNITTTDFNDRTEKFATGFDYWTIDSTLNGEALSPVTQDPFVGISTQNFTVQLALNTDEYGRTFQDRSHVFEIRKRPDKIASARVFNLNVRGKRGNIVEAYPAVEYDFTPNDLQVFVGDYIHFQWTGCDTNAQNQAGEGLDRTDRSNLVQIRGRGDNYPVDYESDFDNLFDSDELMLRFAFIDQPYDNPEECRSYERLLADNNNDQNDAEQDIHNCMKMNYVGPYFDGGLIKMNRTGEFHYVSTRNNNFTNRSQKGTITVSHLLNTWAVVVVSVGAVLFGGAVTLAIVAVVAKKSAGSACAGYFG